MFEHSRSNGVKKKKKNENNANSFHESSLTCLLDFKRRVKKLRLR